MYHARGRGEISALSWRWASRDDAGASLATVLPRVYMMVPGWSIREVALFLVLVTGLDLGDMALIITYSNLIILLDIRMAIGHPTLGVCTA